MADDAPSAPSHPTDPAWTALAEALGLGWSRQDAEGRWQAGSAWVLDALGLEPAAAMDAPLAQALGGPGGEALAVAEQLAPPGAAGPALSLDLGPGRRLRSVRWRLPPDGAQGGGLLTLWDDQGPTLALEAERLQALAQLAEARDAREALARSEAERRLRDAPVAGVVPATQFPMQLGREIDLSRREHRLFALVLIGADPDPVRPPEASAAVVQALGQGLRASTRAMDTPCQLDGVGYALLMSGCALADAHARMEAFRRRCVTELIAHGGGAVHATVSIGIAVYPHSADQADRLLARAREAWDEARAQGGNRVCLARIPLDGD